MADFCMTCGGSCVQDLPVIVETVTETRCCRCGGTGRVGRGACWSCKGAGFLLTHKQEIKGWRTQPCVKCNGLGGKPLGLLADVEVQPLKSGSLLQRRATTLPASPSLAPRPSRRARQLAALRKG